MSGLVYFGVFFAMFTTLERLFPGRHQPVLRPEWATDGLFYFGQYFLWTGLIISGLLAVADGLALLPLQALQGWTASLPIWAQIATVIVLCDLTIYWGHRLSHRFEFLWRFHRVHHTTEHLDWLAAYREHPLDGFYTRLLENLPALLLGFPLEVIAGFVAFRGLWALFIHSNVSLRLGALEVLVGSPRLHHWHHELSRHSGCNFANLSPLMDVLFGTYYNPREGAPKRFGTSGSGTRHYVGQLLEPLGLWGRSEPETAQSGDASASDERAEHVKP